MNVLNIVAGGRLVMNTLPDERDVFVLVHHIVKSEPRNGMGV